MGVKIMRALFLLALRLRARFFGVHFVWACWDSEAHVWFVQHSSVPGLRTEADTAEHLLERIKVMVPELLALNSGSNSSIDGDDHRRPPVPVRATFEECIEAAA